MRRLARILLNAVTMLSLVLFVATVALWVRSYWRGDYIRFVRPGRPNAESFFAHLVLGQGGAGIQVGLLSPEWAGRVWPERWDWKIKDQAPIGYADDWSANRWGFSIEARDDFSVFRSRIVVFPLWLPTLLLALLPLARLVRLVRRRHKPGLCPDCGYDLRASKDRCPECGRPISSA